MNQIQETTVHYLSNLVKMMYATIVWSIIFVEYFIRINVVLIFVSFTIFLNTRLLILDGVDVFQSKFVSSFVKLH